jgi:hypothetical protein
MQQQHNSLHTGATSHSQLDTLSFNLCMLVLVIWFEQAELAACTWLTHSQVQAASCLCVAQTLCMRHNSLQQQHNSWQTAATALHVCSGK